MADCTGPWLQYGRYVIILFIGDVDSKTRFIMTHSPLKFQITSCEAGAIGKSTFFIPPPNQTDFSTYE